MKIFFPLFIILFSLTFFSCSKKNNSDFVSQTFSTNNPKKIVCNIFPIYDWTREITKNSNGAEVSLIIKNGIDLHNFTPTVNDIAKILKADIVFYIGGESDAWILEILKQNPRLASLNLLGCLGTVAKQEEFQEGMQRENDSNSTPAYDEHIWLSFKNAIILTDAICKSICNIDKENAALYKENQKHFEQKLIALDNECKEVVNSSKNKTLLFGDRFPFRYFVDDYNLSYYAAFLGCSAETEASFKTIIFLASKLNELNLSSVCILENSDNRIAEAIIKNALLKNAQNKNAINIVTMNSLQSITEEDIKNGITFTSLMKKNIETLRTALN